MATVVPSIPQNVVVQAGNGQVLITWSAIAGVTGYSIQRSTDGVNFSALSTPSANRAFDATAAVGSQYWYQVAGVNASGTGPYSASQNIIPALPGQMSLGELRLRAQQRADRVASTFVTTSEWNSYINQSYFELYDILVQKFQDQFVATEYRFSLTGASTYALPDGSSTYLNVNSTAAQAFYKCLGVDLAINTANNAWLTLDKYMFIERNTYVYPQLTSNLLGVANLAYRIEGNNLTFIPTPQANQMGRIWYIPRLSTLLADTDMCDGVSGWTEYIITDAAIKALQKEESDVSVLAAQKAELMHRIEAAAENRDAGRPERISDTRNNTGYGGQGNPFGGMPFGGY